MDGVRSAIRRWNLAARRVLGFALGVGNQDDETFAQQQMRLWDVLALPDDPMDLEM